MKNDSQTLIDQMMQAARTGKMTLETLINRAETLKSAGRSEEAIKLYKIWIACTNSPNKFVAFFNWGVLLAEQGNWDSAIVAYQHALKVNPALHQAKINLGLSYERKGEFETALNLWTEVAASDPLDGNSAEMACIALNHKGRLQETQRQYDQAEESLRQSLAINPHQSDAIQHWVHLRQRQCRWPALSPLPDIRVNSLLSATSPLAMLALTDDPALQWLSSQSFLKRKFNLTMGHLAKNRHYQHDKLRIGYVSGDLCTHAVGLLMADLIEAHDKAAFEVFAFDYSPEDGTPYRQRLKQAFDRVIDIRLLSDVQVAQQVLAHEIDVLIDLHGLSSGARPGIFALRPAPLQGTYLGFIGTTAMPWLDFVVTDRFALPEGLQPYFAEMPLYVDGSFLPLHHEPLPAHTLTRASLGLPKDAVVLASFNNIYKLTEDVFESWVRILKKSPQAVLWLLDDNEWATGNLRQRFAAAKVPSAQVVFAQRCAHLEYRQRLTLADLYLDTFPYNAGSTARDVMDAGLPLVTLSGQTFISRMAGSLLHHAGMDELITHDLESYENRIVELINDPAEVARLRKRLKLKSRHWRNAPARLISSFESQLQVLYAQKVTPLNS